MINITEIDYNSKTNEELTQIYCDASEVLNKRHIAEEKEKNKLLIGKYYKTKNSDTYFAVEADGIVHCLYLTEQSLLRLYATEDTMGVPDLLNSHYYDGITKEEFFIIFDTICDSVEKIATDILRKMDEQNITSG